jgi:hypothetical protein
MNKTIWKYTLGISDAQILALPKGATILSVAEQYGEVTLWALVDPDKELEHRLFYIFGTGHPVPNTPGTFLGTVQIRDLVWHVFTAAHT